MDDQSKKKKKKGYIRSERTKLRNLPPTQQPRDIPPKIVRKGLPTITGHEKVPRFPIREGQR